LPTEPPGLARMFNCFVGRVARLRVVPLVKGSKPAIGWSVTEIGRATCRERVGNGGGAVASEKKMVWRVRTVSGGWGPMQGVGVRVRVATVGVQGLDAPEFSFAQE